MFVIGVSTRTEFIGKSVTVQKILAISQPAWRSPLNC